MWKIDTGKTGIPAIFAPYQYGIIKNLLETDAGMSNSQLHKELEAEGYLISRASVINYTNKLEKAGVIKFRYESGKGGYHRKYYTKSTHEDIVTIIASEIMFTLLTAFPQSDFLKGLTDEGLRQ